MDTRRGALGLTSTALVVLALVGGCAFASASPDASKSCPGGAAPAPTDTSDPAGPEGGDLVIVGRIVTMDDPPIAEALLMEEGRVTCAGSRDEVLALAADQVPVIDIGSNVAYPGFIDAHAHWIGDRDYYGIGSPEEAMDEAVSRGWTTISEQWVDQERLTELEALAAEDALPLRVDAYLALNALEVGAYYGDWYADRQPGFVGGPNPLHHRIEHALQVTDDQLDRMAAMNLVPVIQLDGAAVDWVLWAKSLDEDGRDYQAEGLEWLGRWRDFLDAGLHVAGSTDVPWFLVDFALADDIARPVDLIAGGMDGHGRVYSDMPEWVLDQLLTAEEGLRAVTIDAAWALGDEANRGHLAPGTLGDVTILSGDVLGATPDEIRAMTVIATVVDGIPAYCDDAEMCSEFED